jgi:hypothetical protein
VRFLRMAAAHLQDVIAGESILDSNIDSDDACHKHLDASMDRVAGAIDEILRRYDAIRARLSLTESEPRYGRFLAASHPKPKT